MLNEVKNISILGAGISGLGAAKLAKKLNMQVFVSDMADIDLDTQTTLTNLNVEWESGGHNEDRILNSDVIVKSPGISPEAHIIVKAVEQGISVISEIEFAYRYCKGKVIAITGSNGKTTTANLIFHLLGKAGKNVALVGNIGESFAGNLSQGNKDYYVIEVSSFQLDDIITFKPDIAIILNVTPDHLDRYQYKLENYADSKFQIIKNQDENDYFIYNTDDEVIMKGLEKRKLTTKKIPFSIIKKEANGGFLQDNDLIINLNNNPFNMSVHELALQGKHNIYNSMAAAIAGKILDLRKDIIRESLSDFQNMEHRLEFVMKVHGISFFNDSKATNVNATWYALESAENPVVWIVGGIDKGNDYEALKALVSEKVKAIVCLGKDNKKIHNAFGKLVERIEDTNNATDAVNMAYAMSKKGDTVLLSPACASFDLFENYEERGQLFKKAVRAL